MTDTSHLTASLAGKTAIVCGSTQGIGKAIAIALAEHGATVCLVARHAGGLAKVQEELSVVQEQKHDHLAVDFTDWRAVRDKVAAWVHACGPVHILVNNSGGPPAGPAVEAEPEAYVRALEQHLVCNQVLVQAVAPAMCEHKYGRVINVISTSVIMPIMGLGVSNAIRGAVANWARTLAAELGPFGVTVNSILPGFTATARLDAIISGRASRAGTSATEVAEKMKLSVPARRFGEPEEIAAVAAFLASPAAGYVNGVNLPVDGGRLAAQ